MDGLGSEVGNKMRSAVKAKLIELGSGSAGYIDDELPDYVMIMVANKRSKDQMIGDLSLFLGKNTDVFVNWLHQVLEKLQEVTLPSNAVQKSKSKTSESSTADKRDKKAKPKKRGAKDKSPDRSPERSTTPPIQTATTSITDVFADHLIQKARKVIEPPLSVKKAERNGGTTNDGFDIPTISEIAKKAVGAVVCRKEITELAELQKKIDQAKRQLRHMADESEDEDFLNLGADKMDFDAELSNNSKETIATSVATKSSETSVEKAHEAKTRQKITFDEKDSPSKRQSVLNRLGTRGTNEIENDKNDKNEKNDRNGKNDKNERNDKGKNIISLSAHRRMEQAIYVPAHRRTSEQSAMSRRSEPERVRERSPNRSSDLRSRSNRDDGRSTRDIHPRRSRDANEPRDLREKVRQRERDIEQRGSRTKVDTSRESHRNEDRPNRIGSRVIVAPAKPEYDEVEIEVPISSVVKVKPRPLIPRSKQASKNLLLRAVAEAQKSTALAKPAVREFKAIEKNTKELYTKSFRDKLQKDNIVVEIAHGESATLEIDDNTNEELDVEDEEYVPTSESIDEDSFVYIPQAIHNEGSKEITESKTQFVVTLDSLGFPQKKQLSPKPNARDLNREKRDAKMHDERKRVPITNRIGKRPAEAENELESRKAVESSNNRPPLKRKRTPIKFDIKDRESESDTEPVKKRRSGSNDRKSTDKEYRKSTEKDDSRRRDDRSNERERDANESTSKIRTKTSSQNKYDNLPPLSSAITVTSNEIKLTKKDRCKFYPSCTRGERCEYYHPSTPCKAFPNCKYGDVCLYIHPKCKFDLTCSRLNCNFTHTPIVSAAPPLASHVVPVSNYKKIVATPLPTLCRFYPNCSNTLCEFYHPKPCKFGKSCTNKVECNFYHFDLPIAANNASMPSKNKLKWVASAV